MRLEQEKLQSEADIKTRGSEMVTLQRELETLVATAKKLDAQRADAKKRLDELSREVRYFVKMLTAFITMLCVCVFTCVMLGTCRNNQKHMCL